MLSQLGLLFYRDIELPYVPFVGLSLITDKGHFGPVTEVTWHAAAKIFFLHTESEDPQTYYGERNLPLPLKNELISSLRRRRWRQVNDKHLREWWPPPKDDWRRAI